MNGEELTRWTIRLALAAYVARLGLGLAVARSWPRHETVSRLLWTLACAFLWIHVGCAFATHHHWSHAEAYAHTAQRTKEVAGLDWGGGLWLNYLLMVLWAADVAWWWLSPRSFRARSPAIDRLWQGWLAFVVFNATVVFETGAIRWAGIVATVVLLAAWLSCATKRS